MLSSRMRPKLSASKASRGAFCAGDARCEASGRTIFRGQAIRVLLEAGAELHRNSGGGHMHACMHAYTRRARVSTYWTWNTGTQAWQQAHKQTCRHTSFTNTHNNTHAHILYFSHTRLHTCLSCTLYTSTSVRTDKRTSVRVEELLTYECMKTRLRTRTHTHIHMYSIRFASHLPLCNAAPVCPLRPYHHTDNVAPIPLSRYRMVMGTRDRSGVPPKVLGPYT